MTKINIQQPVPNIYQVKIPIPTALRDVNCYIVRGDDGWSIVDTGFYSDTTKNTWFQVFQQLGIKPTDVVRIVVTHYHGDHYGASGWLQEICQAPVIMHQPEVEQIRQFWQPDYPDKIRSFFRQHGMPAHIIGDVTKERLQLRSRIIHPDHVETVNEGDEIPIGNRLFRVIWTPGHSDGLMVLWNKEDGILFSNDMILDPITPNISVWPDAAVNPLKLYLNSLEKVSAMPADITLPGHRRVIYDLPGRCRQLKQHHAERLQATMSLLAENDSPWEVAKGLFEHVMTALANTRFALTETIAHLEYLYYEGQVHRIRRADGSVRYVPTGSGCPQRKVAGRP